MKFLFFYPIFFSLLSVSTNHTFIDVVFAQEDSAEVLIQIEKGMSLGEVAQDLKKKGLIKSVLYLKFWAWLKNQSRSIKFGEYLLRRGHSEREILNILVSGKTRLYKITFPEGMHLFEMAQQLEKDHFLQAKDFIQWSQNPDWIQKLLGEKLPSLEGYLFPDTYHLSRPILAQTVIEKMVKNFLKVYSQIERQQQNSNHFLTRQEIIILASIVEKETGIKEERDLISSVFHNRLRKKMRLESDPTILYGMMKKQGIFSLPKNIRRKDILEKTDYNTYRLKRFPAGPIGNPGKAALLAVFQAKKSPYLFFVSRGDGSHVFSETFSEHKKAVDKFQRKIKRK